MSEPYDGKYSINTVAKAWDAADEIFAQVGQRFSPGETMALLAIARELRALTLILEQMREDS